MEELIEKGYARKGDNKGPVAKLGMFHIKVC